MQKKLIAMFLGAALALSLAGVADAAKGGQSAGKRAYQFHGTVESVASDEDPLTEDSISVLVTKANGNGKRAGIVPGSSVTVAVSDATRFYGAAASAADIAPGDPVKVKARSDGLGGYAAQTVKEKAPEEELEAD